MINRSLLFVYISLFLLIISCKKPIMAEQYFIDNKLNYPVSFQELSQTIKVANPSSTNSEVEIEATEDIENFHKYIMSKYTLNECRSLNDRGVAFIFEKPFMYKEIDNEIFYAVKN